MHYDALIIKQKVKQIIYKIVLNKILKPNKVIKYKLNIAIFSKYCVNISAISFYKIYLKKIQLIYFKRAITIVLRKLSKKNYLKLFVFKLIALLNTLRKILKLIILKRLRCIARETKTILSIQIKLDNKD